MVVFASASLGHVSLSTVADMAAGRRDRWSDGPSVGRSAVTVRRGDHSAGRDKAAAGCAGRSSTAPPIPAPDDEDEEDDDADPL